MEAAAIFHFNKSEGAIQAPGGKTGALVSKQVAYENYHLTVEYKWGPVPASSEKPRPRRSTLILHAQDTADQRPFMPGIACLIVPGDTGALQLRGDVRIKAPVADKVESINDKGETVKPAAKEQTDVFKMTRDKADSVKAGKDKGDSVKAGKDKGDSAKAGKDKVDPVKAGKDKGDSARTGTRNVLRRVYRPGSFATLLINDVKNWSGIVHRLGNDLIQGEDDNPVVTKDDLERTGDWNKLECICDGDIISVRLNGKEVNACTHANPRKGRIALLAEGGNIYLRRIDVLPLLK